MNIERSFYKMLENVDRMWIEFFENVFEESIADGMNANDAFEKISDEATEYNLYSSFSGWVFMNKDAILEMGVDEELLEEF
jgi:hypothetical protein